MDCGTARWVHHESSAMKCKRCRGKAEVQLRQHNAAFCRPCFVDFFQRQVQRAIDREKMFTREEPVLVAISGGKDSLALWDALHELGYETTGLHLELGIGTYSEGSLAKSQAFAAKLGRRLINVTLADESMAVPEMARFTHRPACAACGTAKRHHFDRIALAEGFAVLATGHNLDDEAARLLGNLMRWQARHLAKQSPVLEATHERFTRKVKPLFRITEYEAAVYAFMRGIDYVIDECPNAGGATQLILKDALNRIEASMPGSKLTFLQEFLRHGRPMFQIDENRAIASCEVCGMPCYGQVCSYCSLTAEIERKKQQAEHRGLRGSPPPSS